MDHSGYYDGFQKYYYQDDPNMYYEESLVETLDNSVQQSVDKAISRALQPYVPLKHFQGRHEGERAGFLGETSKVAEPAGASGLIKK